MVFIMLSHPQRVEECSVCVKTYAIYSVLKSRAKFQKMPWRISHMREVIWTMLGDAHR